MGDETLDLLVVGAGPTGIAVGAEARRQGLELLLVERGGLCAAIQGYPTDLVFFTTRERLEVAGIPFTIPDAKPSRAQVLAYYREVARHYRLPLALREEVTAVEPRDGVFRVVSRGRRGELARHARAVVLATGYFGRPRSLGVPGEDLPWVSSRYREAYGHFGEEVVVVGGGNSAAEAALELFRWGARVTLVHHGESLKPGVKYWLKPDLENRLAAGEIRGLFGTTIEAFTEQGIAVAGPHGGEQLPADAAYVLVGYRPELELAIGAGVKVDPQTLVPACDPESCESDVPGFYIAGTLQAGRFTDRIFVENSRDHAPRIVDHLLRRLRPREETMPVGR
jgi:thioredoxin reductase (NADPH)